MPNQPDSWLGLVALVWALGLRHGVDADHIAAVDSLSRLNAAGREHLARWCGGLFALGHGAVIATVAAMATLSGQIWSVPRWLDGVGAWLSIALLAWLGLANLRALQQARPTQLVEPWGWKSRLLGRWLQARCVGTVFGVGALFALSFDTLAQAVWLAFAAGPLGGLGSALGLSALFTAGMLTAGLANSWWLIHVLRRGGAGAVRLSRWMAGTVATLSLLMAATGVARQWHGHARTWLDDNGLWLTLALLATLLAVWLLTLRAGTAPDGPERPAPLGRPPRWPARVRVSRNCIPKPKPNDELDSQTPGRRRRNGLREPVSAPRGPCPDADADADPSQREGASP